MSINSLLASETLFKAGFSFNGFAICAIECRLGQWLAEREEPVSLLASKGIDCHTAVDAEHRLTGADILS
jgi:hypothetical protein